MDVGVYVKDNSSNSWTLYNTGLPNVPVHDMEISPAAPTLLRAGTYGRGVYQVDVILPTTPPVSKIGAPAQICAGVAKVFSDNSAEDPTSWNWSVSPSTGVTISSSSVQNPTISFATGGIYTVSLIASNGFGTGSTGTQTVNVNAAPALTLTSSGSSPTVCVDETIVLTASGAATYTWLPNVKTGSTLSFTATLQNTTTFTVNAKDANGCVGSETLSLIVSECTGIPTTQMNTNLFSVFPNPASNRVTIKNRTEIAMDVHMEVEDASGKTVIRQTGSFKKDKNEIQLNIAHLANGVYMLKIKTEKGDSYFTKIVKE